MTWKYEDGSDDIVMQDIEDETIVQAISDDLSRSRQSQHAERKSQPFDGISQILPLELQQIVIIDTNFAISHLSIVKGLVDSYEDSRVLVLIPWVVIQELDGLKGASSHYGEANLAVLARNAVRFIHTCLSTSKAGLRGQKLGESLVPRQTGDDAILDCARYWYKIQAVGVTLLSNDRNLCSKMLIHDIGAISFELGLSAGKILEKIRANRRDDTRKMTNASLDENDKIELHGSTTEVVTDASAQTVRNASGKEQMVEPCENMGVIEMEVDPLLPPLASRDLLQRDPFAALAAKAGAGRFEKTTKALQVRRSVSPTEFKIDKTRSELESQDINMTSTSRAQSPSGIRAHSPEVLSKEIVAKQDRSSPVAARHVYSGSASGVLDQITEELYTTMLKTCPQLVYDHLLAELGDRDSVDFLLGTKLDAIATLHDLVRVIADNWFICFSKILYIKGRHYDQQLKHMASKLEKLKQCTTKNLAEVEQSVRDFTELWSMLSKGSVRSEKYKKRRDEWTTDWLLALQGLTS